MRLTCGRALVWFFARIVLLETVGQCYGRKTEFCETDEFEASCNPSEVVVMETAWYGRMKLGRCVKTDYGFVGCQANVKEHFDSICSGRRSCALRLPDRALDKLKECPHEFKTYLEANYTCIPVEASQCQLCQTSQYAKVTGASGYLASIVTNETRQQSECGSSKCPWLLQVNPGQRINLTLFDFSTSNNKVHGSSLDGCFRFAVIKEKRPSATSSGYEIHDSPACSGGGRVRHLYTSSTNEIEIHVISPEVFSSQGQFLFYYEAVGCPDIPPEPNSWFKRKNDQEATGGCVTDALEWAMTCVGSKWEGDDRRNCPQDVLPPGPATGKPSFTLPLGVLVAIIIGIALVIGVLILTIGLVCFKSYAHRRQPVTYRRPDTYGSRHRRSSAFHEDMSAATPLQYAKHPPEVPPEKRHVPANIRENVYMESRPLPSIPNQPDNDADDKSERSSKIQVYRTSSGREHYHNPRLVVNTRFEAPYGMPVGEYDPQYFVLDPDNELAVDIPPSPCCVAASASGPPRRQARGGISSAKQKSPEEENAENFYL